MEKADGERWPAIFAIPSAAPHREVYRLEAVANVRQAMVELYATDSSRGDVSRPGLLLGKMDAQDAQEAGEEIAAAAGIVKAALSRPPEAERIAELEEELCELRGAYKSALHEIDSLREHFVGIQKG